MASACMIAYHRYFRCWARKSSAMVDEKAAAVDDESDGDKQALVSLESPVGDVDEAATDDDEVVVKSRSMLARCCGATDPLM
jgi:hypothetical protein